MKKFWHNPLWYKEWKSAKWITLLMTFVLFIFNFLSIVKSLAGEKNILMKYKDIIPEYELKHWFNHALLENGQEGVIVLFGVVVVFTIIMFKNERESSTCGLIASMPFEREKIISTKFKIGFLSIFISFFINFIFTSIFYFVNLEYIYDPYSIIVQWTAINMLCCMAFFSVICFVQTLIGQYLVGAAVGCIVLAVPSFLISEILTYVQYNLGFQYSYEFIIKSHKISNWIFIPEMNSTEWVNDKLPEKLLENHSSSLYYQVYSNYSAKIFTLILMIVVFSALAVYCYKKNRFENNGLLLIFDNLQPVFKWGVAICLGFVLADVFLDVKPENVIWMDTFLVLGIVLGHLGSNKVLKLCKR